MRLPETSVEIDPFFVGPNKALDIEKAKEVMERELAGLNQRQRHRVLDKLNRQFTTELKRTEASKAQKESQLAALKDVQEWFSTATTWNLERNDCSRLHHFKEAWRAGRVLATDRPPGSMDPPEFGNFWQHTFVVKQDWAKAFEHATGIDDSIKLPYNLCTFEFRFSGRNVIATAFDNEGDVGFTAFIQSGDCWVHLAAVRARNTQPEDKVAQAIWDQIRAICIALDAEVATHSVVRAPHALNQKREAAGKIPLSDFHVVELARRHRVSNPTGLVGGGGKKRMHFRRGHWRHFETSKTWVRWCLVGDPDLGFIQKQYTL